MKNSVAYLPYNRQDIDNSDIEAVTQVLKEDIITRGPHVKAFEEEFAAYCGADYAVAFNSGTSALLGVCYAARIGKGDRVISTPNTFVSTVGSPVHCGATPVFVDIDLATGNLLLDEVENNINETMTRGRPIVMPVHFAGIPVDMEELDRRIRNPEVLVIEDAAHALGSTYKSGERVGSCTYSAMTVFSLHAVKNITTGEGGVVTTNSRDYYERLLTCRNNCMQRGFDDPWYYEVTGLTGNLNMTDFQAALGSSQLKRLDTFVEKRRHLMKLYRKHLNESVQLLEADDDRTAFHLACVKIDFEKLGTTRTEVMQQLQDSGIGSQYHYIPVYRHPIFKKICGSIADYFPNMETHYKQALSLPLFVQMRDEDVEHVCSTLNRLLAGLGN